MNRTADTVATPAERTAMIPTERLWTVQDLAEYLGVPVMTICYWRNTGYGPKGTKIGRYVRYRPDEVRAWYESQTEKAG